MKQELNNNIEYILSKILDDSLKNKIQIISKYIIAAYFQSVYFPPIEDICEKCSITKAEAERIYYLYREYLFLKIAGLVNFYVNIDRGHGLKPDLDKYLQYISKTESDKNK